MATFTDEWFRRLLFNNGEGLDYTDLNNVSRNIMNGLRAAQFLGGLQNITLDDGITPGSELDVEGQTRFLDLTDYTTDLVLTPTPQNGFWRPNGVANQLLFYPGILAMIVDEPSSPDNFPAGGDGPFIMGLMGSVGSLGLTLTTTAGDATNPRIDIVELKMEFVNGDNTSRDFKDATTGVVTTTAFDKSRKIRFTYQLKAGTPAASPSYPTPTAGFAAMCAVYVPATHNAAHSITNIRDLRMPMGRVKVYDIPAHLLNRWGPAPWTIHATDFLVTSPVGGSFLYAHVPTASRHDRLVGIGVAAVPEGAEAANLIRLRYDLNIPTFSNLSNHNLSNPLFSAGSGFAYRLQGLNDIADAVHGQGMHVGVRAANTRVGSPIWCDGSTAGPAAFRTGTASTDSLALQLGGDGSTVSVVRFYTVGGLF